MVTTASVARVAEPTFSDKRRSTFPIRVGRPARPPCAVAELSPTAVTSMNVTTRPLDTRIRSGVDGGRPTSARMARHRLDLARGRKRLLRGGGSWSRKAMHAVIGWFALVRRSVFMVDRAATVARR